MPYVLLALGALIGLYGLYRFFINATPKQVIAMVLAVVTGILAIALLLLALTGRLPAAMGLLAMLWPLGIGYYKNRAAQKNKKPEWPKPTAAMTRAEALDILGLPQDADDDVIEDAYKRLMIKLHPDQQGSDWMAAKLNAARDFLLKN